MIEVSFSSSFKKAFKKRIGRQSDLKQKFWQKVEKFVLDPFDRSLKTHKLSGRLQELWSFTIDYDVRVLFYFTDEGNAVFVDIGSHDEVY